MTQNIITGTQHDKKSFGRVLILMNNSVKGSFINVLFPIAITAQSKAYPNDRGLLQSLKFGSKPPPLKPDGFQAVLENFDCFAKNGKVDVESSYQQLSRGARHHLDRLQKNITPAEVKQFKENGLFGKLEEAADILFEMYTLQVLRQGIVPRKELDAWKQHFQVLKSQHKDFDVVFYDLQKHLTPEQIKAFQEVSQLDEKNARKFLALVCIKFMIHTPKNKPFDTIGDAQERLTGETQELAEGLSRFSPQRLLLSASSWLFSNVPGIPLTCSRKVPEWYARKALDCPITYRDMTRYVFIKQLRRQELHYEKPDLTYSERKRILKPFETLVEAAFLKEAYARKHAAKPTIG